MNALQTKRALDVPPEMMLGLAMGSEPPLTLAAQHGFTPSELDALQSQEWFNQEVARLRSELLISGKLGEIKFGMMGETLITRAFVESCDPDVPISVKLEVAKYLLKVGNREPKPQAAGSQGPMFSIKIDLGNNQQILVEGQPVTQGTSDSEPTTPKHVEAHSEDHQVKPKLTDIPDEAPKLITSLPLPDFDLSVDAVLKDLEGGASQ
jgi:hypothetical protein